MPVIAPPLHAITLPRGGRGVRATVHKPEQKGVVMPAQAGSQRREHPVLLFDDPEAAIEELLEGRAGSIEDAKLINILSTELRERRLILADGLACWGESEARECLLIPEHRAGDYIQALPMGFALDAALSRERLVELVRPYFFVERLPGRLTAERIAYLLSHGNEQGAATIAEITGDAYLLKARTEVWEALLGRSDAADAVLVAELMRRIGCSTAGVDVVFHMRPPALEEVQRAALLADPLPACSFRMVL